MNYRPLTVQATLYCYNEGDGWLYGTQEEESDAARDCQDTIL